MERTSNRRSWRWGLGVIAVAAALTGAAPALASFTVQSAPTYTAVTFGTPTLSTPTMGSTCTWTNSTTLQINWTANSSWASGVEVQRNTNSGTFADRAAVTPVGTVTYSEAPATPTSNTYGYQVLAASGTAWRSSASSAIYSNACIGTISSPVTGTAATAKVNLPEQMVFDSSGNMLIADTANHCVREVPVVTGTYFTVSMTAGNIYTAFGTCGTSGNTNATLSSPEAIAVDNSNNLYIADRGNAVVRKLAAGASTTTVLAGTRAPRETRATAPPQPPPSSPQSTASRPIRTATSSSPTGRTASVV